MGKISITIPDIEYLAEMSGLEFSDDEKIVMRDQVSGILEMLDGCAKIDSQVPENVSSRSLSDLRNDEIFESISISDVFTNAPAGDKGYFVVPKVVD